jgi:gag-polypeptide of LTR copia-type
MQLHSLQKKHLSMQSYLDQKHSIVDRLRLVGSPISDDLQLYIIHRLSTEYDSLIASLNSRSGAIPFNELVGLLLTHEQCLNKNAMLVLLVLPLLLFTSFSDYSSQSCILQYDC